jgi:hypothetical protein
VLRRAGFGWAKRLGQLSAVSPGAPQLPGGAILDSYPGARENNDTGLHRFLLENAVTAVLPCRIVTVSTFRGDRSRGLPLLTGRMKEFTSLSEITLYPSRRFGECV